MYPYSEQTPSAIPFAYQRETAFQRSPFIQGFLAGVKGALIGAGGGAIVNALRGSNTAAGAAIGGMGVGLISGVTKAISQSLDNTNQESIQRYYANRLKEQEPAIFMPPPANFAQIFSTYHNWAHQGQKYTKPMLTKGL